MRKPLLKNKKGNAMVLIIFFIFLFAVLFLGFILSTGSAVINWVFDEAVPELSDLGMAGDANMTDIASYTIAPLNSMVQSLQSIVGVMFVVMLLASVGFIIIIRQNPSKWLMALFFMLAIVLIIASIFISNMYEDFYKGDDELGSRLREQSLMSFMMLHCPTILTIITFVTGIIVFSGLQTEELG